MTGVHDKSTGKEGREGSLFRAVGCGSEQGFPLPALRVQDLAKSQVGRSVAWLSHAFAWRRMAAMVRRPSQMYRLRWRAC